MSLSPRQREYLIGLLQNEIKEMQNLVEEIQAGSSDQSVTMPQRLLPESAVPDEPESEPTPSEPTQPGTIRRVRKAGKKQARPPRRSSERINLVSLHEITSILKEEGRPLTPFKIKERLRDAFNIVLTDEALEKRLELGVKRGYIRCPQEGQYAVAD
jgi:hypothetical protein